MKNVTINIALELENNECVLARKEFASTFDLRIGDEITAFDHEWTIESVGLFVDTNHIDIDAGSGTPACDIPYLVSYAHLNGWKFERSTRCSAELFARFKKKPTKRELARHKF